MDLVTRLKQYMEHVELPISQFADIAQIPRPTLSQILTGRNKKISNELLTKLHVAFPSLNISWLLFGDGEMDIANENDANAPLTPKTTPTPSIFAKEKAEVPQAENPLPDLPGIPELDMQKGYDISSEIKNRYVQTNESQKKIKTIIVFYSDNSFEIFNPA